jgi:large subunit ribosomal protein L35
MAKKYKMKTRKAIAKRVRITATGELKIRHINRAHHAYYRTSSKKRHLRKGGILSKSAKKMFKDCIIGGKR